MPNVTFDYLIVLATKIFLLWA